MKVFISQSGPRAKAAASALRQLPRLRETKLIILIA